MARSERNSQADVASSLLYGIDGNTIVQSNDGQSLDTVLRDYCKQYGFEPEGLQFDACGDGHALTLYEYTALRWAGVTVPASVQIQSFTVPELTQDDVFQTVGQHIFSLFKHQGHRTGNYRNPSSPSFLIAIWYTNGNDTM